MCIFRARAWRFRWLSASVFWLAFGLPVLLRAQILRQELRVQFDSLHPADLRVEQVLTLNDSVAQKGTLLLCNGLAGYAHIRSPLAHALTDRYRLDFHFSSASQRSALRIDSVSTTYKTGATGGSVRLHWQKKIHSIRLVYRIHLPDARFTGVGYGKYGYFLHHFWLLPQPSGNCRADIALDDRRVLNIPTRILLNHPPAGLYWQSNARIIREGDTLIFENNNTNIRLLGTRNKARVFRSGKRILVAGPRTWNGYSDVEMALAWERVQSYLKDFPLPEKLLITRADLDNFPVYDVQWLPVLRPFARDFRLQTQMLYQAVRLGLQHLHIDKRNHYGFWSGLEQWYLAGFVQRYFPGVRLTGLPVRWPVLRNYYLFRVPYEHKYYLLYRYIGRMNYDQAIALPADSLSNFNRTVGVPAKAFLGWRFLENHVGPDSLHHSINRLLNLARRQSVSPAGFRQISGIKAPWLWNNFYHTAGKIDYSLHIRRQNGQKFIRIHRHGQTAFPVVLEQNGRQEPLPFFAGDTLIPLAGNKQTIRLNPLPLYPEINLRNNTAPRLHKPLRIRFFKDLEEPFTRQLFVNPSVQYNLYDGVLLGLGLNNKSFIDKSFSWELKPEYGFSSRQWTGSADFRYIKRVVRPYLFGWSMGGYAKRYHYDFDRWYRTASLFAVLSFKDRAHKFLKGQDYSAELLWVDKEVTHPDETSAYLVGRLAHNWYLRGLIKNYSWTNSLEFHRRFVKFQTEFRFRSFVDRFRQIEWRTYFAWMPYNRTRTSYFLPALSRPTDYLFKYNYYGRSESTGLFHQQYVYAEGAFKVFYPDQYANLWMWTHNLNVGLYKRLNLFADIGWAANRGQVSVFHYDAGLRLYLVPDYFEFYFPVVSDMGWIPLDRHYWEHIRIMFVFDLPNLFKMFSRSWY